ncbi:hypothetical protein DEO72_LG10g2570 [Vigna unguiculata]|uniref:Uncharacterized protein n=1 Tax=Vigna unguiculata TaxID=3917 RepID=A0A4D6NHC3_VIGUN|nr:hypothetical protein DEO72_LG10g2570 [Vigna unguiculata]
MSNSFSGCWKGFLDGSQGLRLWGQGKIIRIAFRARNLVSGFLPRNRLAALKAR